MKYIVDLQLFWFGTMQPIGNLRCVKFSSMSYLLCRIISLAMQILILKTKSSCVPTKKQSTWLTCLTKLSNINKPTINIGYSTFLTTIVRSCVPELFTHLLELSPGYWLSMLPWLGLPQFLSSICVMVPSQRFKFTNLESPNTCKMYI